MKFLVSSLLLSVLFLNGCKKGASDVTPSFDDVCLIAKRTKSDPQGRIIYDYTYTYNSKGLVSSIKYYTTQSSTPTTDTESFQYNSDGQVIKKTSSNTTTTYTYDNKLLIEENADLGGLIYSTKYFYNADSRKSKVISKNTRNNEILANTEQTYFYKDTLLIKIMYRNLISNSPVQGLDYSYKYDAQNRLIEEQAIRQNNSVYETKKYQYGSDRNVIKMTQFNANNYKEYEEVFTYANNKLIEKTMFSFYADGLPPITSKEVYEYNHDNLSKVTYFYAGELGWSEQYKYTCDK
jgi:hypothetical protein